MSDPLPTTLLLVLIVLAITMIATLLQVRRTARKLEAFLETAQRDLTALTADVHAFRLHVEQLVDPLQARARELGVFTRMLGDLARSVHSAQEQFRNAYTRASGFIQALARGIRSLGPLTKR